MPFTRIHLKTTRYSPVMAGWTVVGPTYGAGVGDGFEHDGTMQQASFGSIANRQFTGMSTYTGHLRFKNHMF